MPEPTLTISPSVQPLRFGKVILFASVFGLLVVVMSFPDYNPNTVRGGYFGTLLMTLWGFGFGLWALGFAKRLSRGVRIQTALLGFEVLAGTLGPYPGYRCPIPCKSGPSWFRY